MKKITLLLYITLSIFLVSSPVFAGNDINWSGDSFSKSFNTFGEGFQEVVSDGVGGMVRPVFEDVKPEFGYVFGPPHGAIRGGLSVFGSTGKNIFGGVGKMVEGAIGWVPVVGMVGGVVNDVFFKPIGDVFGWFGNTVGGMTSKMHPDKSGLKT